MNLIRLYLIYHTLLINKMKENLIKKNTKVDVRSNYVILKLNQEKDEK